MKISGATSDAAGNPQPQLTTRTPRMVLALLCLMYLILYIDRVNIATVAPLMRADLGLSNTQMGLVFSAFSIFLRVQVHTLMILVTSQPAEILIFNGGVWLKSDCYLSSEIIGEHPTASRGRTSVFFFNKL